MVYKQSLCSTLLRGNYHVRLGGITSIQSEYPPPQPPNAQWVKGETSDECKLLLTEHYSSTAGVALVDVGLSEREATHAGLEVFHKHEG